jgi:hypothetical protein
MKTPAQLPIMICSSWRSQKNSGQLEISGVHLRSSEFISHGASVPDEFEKDPLDAGARGSDWRRLPFELGGDPGECSRAWSSNGVKTLLSTRAASKCPGRPTTAWMGRERPVYFSRRWSSWELPNVYKHPLLPVGLPPSAHVLIPNGLVLFPLSPVPKLSPTYIVKSVNPI